ncbi:hypothetical protein Harman_20850 [Haloarcula mannanilytica]|uniref:non-reducing end alpha-L-arabinofuranosidase n=1 Tax=Haloarcula mannanilytica TaxID=2509225 RepID=A0A4C2ELF4_9EURY|nr:alpha-L-arabinofuranosidase C-terminal domain-containing protein [Haloarcula mannanilytica]GCF14150.1 hypothetical protein Harman_20850 [Haloarcula mannanilytica]
MTTLFSHTDSDTPERATVRLDPSRTADREVPAALFGKFGEHLYSPWRVTNALEAQVLYNPTVGSWSFQTREFGADGGRGGIHDPEAIGERIEQYASIHDLPDADRLRAAYDDGTALWWFPYGEAAVETSPDVGTAGDRAQRVEVTESEGQPAGIAQWCYLPVHRTTGFEGRVTLRAPSETTVRVALHSVDGQRETADRGGSLGPTIAETTVAAGAEYETSEFTLEVPESVSTEPGTLFGFSITVDDDDAVIVDRALLSPADHVGTADPEIVDLFADMELPVLRWPGGNFASGYHWQDGVGPVESRPTKPNPAWDGIEPNLFGTDEFLAFCSAVGCDPVICVNAGTGTPEEAARWVEYCNGSTDTEMGALRAEHGHPEPYDVTYWELGNELYGQWQLSWTTPEGYADRFERFREAMTAVDDSIEVLACGNRLTDWNEPTLDALHDGDWLTDHVLVECHADAGTDPVELFNAHSGFAQQLGEEYRRVATTCRDAGLADPRLAVTELQLFTRFDESEDTDDGTLSEDDDAGLLTEETLPGSHSITEAVFDATVVNQCLRGGVVEMVTHSGVGNHGGGIRKQRQRVWADPCFYGQQLGLAVAGGQPVGVDVTCGTYSTDTAFGTDTSQWFGELEPVSDRPVVDAVAVTDATDYDFAAILVHRDAGTGPVEVDVDGGGLLSDVDTVKKRTLTAETMHETNTLDAQDRIAPTEDRVAVVDGTVSLTLPRYSVVTLTVE